ncbi:hypothetical protein N658DRAFT_513005 [Parathielavia hyrcaniae]|uniref:Uncharacterized protein n=1 Tax=Parathielavia hyrcaniae TaxID=113614 RepID=A0AAN6Q9U5_9PEZI|nr:hypothetical protein N658DRAFT_513005 [Parathielavia hyrcaniae]
MRNLVRTYLSAFNELGIETWLMHSALLGWWWSKQLRPQDLDVSMHISEADIFYLASYYNVSTFSFKNPGIPRATRYLLELSPYAKDREQADQLHPADARWIDTKTGLFLNVYAVRYNLSRPVGEGRLRRLSCKDGSEMVDTDLFPLRVTIFEGVPAKVPFCYRELLAMEYGAEALEGSDDTL